MSGPYATFLNPRDPMSGTKWPKSQLLGHSGSSSSPIMITDDKISILERVNLFVFFSFIWPCIAVTDKSRTMIGVSVVYKHPIFVSCVLRVISGGL